MDTFECSRFHGDALPEGVSEENVMAVRSLLAQDYAASFQVNRFVFSRFRVTNILCTFKIELGIPLWKVIADYRNFQNIFLSLNKMEHDFVNSYRYGHSGIHNLSKL